MACRNIHKSKEADNKLKPFIEFFLYFFILMVACIIYVFIGAIGIRGLIPLTILCISTVAALIVLGKRFPLIEEYSPPVHSLTCADCKFSIDKEKFDDDIFLCPDCGARLEESIT
jgi:hypothetical protein